MINEAESCDVVERGEAVGDVSHVFICSLIEDSELVGVLIRDINILEQRMRNGRERILKLVDLTDMF
jgi:hypothetical protein